MTAEEKQGAVTLAEAIDAIDDPALAEIIRFGVSQITPERDAEVARWKAEQEHQERLAARRQRLDLLKRGGVPRKTRNLLRDGDERETDAMREMRQWRGRGIRVLAGGVGAGKTVAAVWWISEHGGSAPLFLCAADLESAGRYDREMRRRWKSASALVLDDLGTEYTDSKGNWLSLLDELVNFYHSEERALIITTNIADPDVLKARVGARVVSRMRQDGGWCPVAGEDLRCR